MRWGCWGSVDGHSCRVAGLILREKQAKVERRSEAQSMMELREPNRCHNDSPPSQFPFMIFLGSSQQGSLAPTPNSLPNHKLQAIYEG